MHSTERVKLYDAEKAVVAAILERRLNQDVQNACVQALLNTDRNVNSNLNKSVNQFPMLVENIELPYNVLKLWQGLNYSELSNPISENEFNIARNYVENLLDIKLSKIQWNHLEYSPSEHSEGSIWPFGDDEHYIFTYYDPYGAISTDLLVHEIGHAADFTVSRLANDDALLAGHKCLHEAIAYYCQFKYLSEFGSSTLRIGSCGGFVFTYLAILVLNYCLKNGLQLNEINPSELVYDSSFNDLVSSYDVFDSTGNYGANFLKDKIIDIQERFKNLVNLIYVEIQPRFGIVLGIYLLDKEPEFIKELILLNTLCNDVVEVSEKIIPDYKDVILNFPDKLIKYFHI